MHSEKCVTLFFMGINQVSPVGLNMGTYALDVPDLGNQVSFMVVTYQGN